MAAPEGNSNAEKFDTPEKRKALCEAYCLHIERGLSDASFPECDPDTIERYMQSYPIDFPTDKVRAAQRKRMLAWEEMGLDGTRGKIKGFNALSWKFNMQNRFDWRDKRDDRVTMPKDGAKELAQRVFDALEAEEENTGDDAEPPQPESPETRTAQ